MSELDIKWTSPQFFPLQELEESARKGAYLLVKIKTKNLCTAFKYLREYVNLTDVSLACEDVCQEPKKIKKRNKRMCSQFPCDHRRGLLLNQGEGKIFWEGLPKG